MPLELIKAKTISGLSLLDLEKKNYVRWAETALDAFLYAGIADYVNGAATQPTDATDLATWTKNDKLAQAGIRMHLAEAEKDYLRDNCTCTTAKEIWDELKKRHRQKSSTQTSLLDDALSITILRDDDMLKSAASIRDLCKQVFEVDATLTADKLARAILLRALSPELKHIREKHEDNDASTAIEIVGSLEKEKRRRDEELKRVAEAERVMAAATSRLNSKPAAKKGRPVCATPGCGGQHATEECWSEGGVMAGKRAEVLEMRAARRKGGGKPNSEPAKASTNKRIALVDGSGKKVYFTLAESDAASDETAASATVTQNEELERLWMAHHARRNSDASDYSMVAAEAFVTTHVGQFQQFAADTGATIHISPVRDDFQTLQAIPPQKIHGVGGNCIEAVFRGDIHLRRDNGSILVLKNAYYVPAASIRLASIGRLADDGYSAVFDSTGFSIVDKKSNLTAASGTRRNGKLYTLDGTIVPTSTQSVNIATKALDLEVWHRRLGHVGVTTVKRMAIGGLVEDSISRSKETVKSTFNA